VGPTPFYGARAEKNPKSRFCHEANEYTCTYVALAAT